MARSTSCCRTRARSCARIPSPRRRQPVQFWTWRRSAMVERAQRALPIDEATIDAFAGGGGASTGIEQAYAEMGLAEVVDVAVNHDEDALAMHAANHPKTLHVREDVFKVDVRKVVGKRLVRLLWLSP